jgi:type II secretory pathway predicted ATPase ExeA
LDRKLDAPNLRQLKQRIVLRCALEPLDMAQTTEYIDTRMEKAGMPHQDVFPPEMIAEIQVRSQGIPRVINAICDNLLLTCFAMETRVTTIEMLDEVSKDMRLEWPGRRPRGQRSRFADESFEQQSPFYTRGD